uniref:HNH endonuclease signature motif containing protein n=1 Tax=Nocardioides massiliensis TaxID=1325935 RepID=UPI000A567346
MAEISGGQVMDRGGAQRPSHPVLTCVSRVRAALDEVADIDPLFATTEAKKAMLTELTELADRVVALRNEVLAAADDVAADTAARRTANWVADVTREHPGRVAHAQDLGEALRVRYQVLGAAVRDGRVRMSQAEIIVKALDKAPPSAPRELRRRAETDLVELAQKWGPKALTRLADRVWSHLDPEGFADHEREQLEKELREAEAQTKMTIRHRGDGTADITARIPRHYAKRLRGYLEAFTAPRRETALTEALKTNGTSIFGIESVATTDEATGAKLSHERVLGEAFCAFLDAYDPNKLPQHGGMATTIIVRIDLDDLRDGLGAGLLPDDGTIPVSEVRRYACTAGIVPAVLDGEGEVLDLGRTQRLFSAAQRKALALKYPTCAAQGCTIPARWCEAHHAGDPWCEGGRTDLDDGVLLCSWHHH